MSHPRGRFALFGPHDGRLHPVEDEARDRRTVAAHHHEAFQARVAERPAREPHPERLT